MKIREENGVFKLDTSQKELEYILSNLLKANNPELSLSDIERVSSNTVKYMGDNRFYDGIERDIRKISSAKFYESFIRKLYVESRKFI